MDTNPQTTPADGKENSKQQSPELLKNEGEVLEGGMMAKGIGGGGNVQVDEYGYQIMNMSEPLIKITFPKTKL